MRKLFVFDFDGTLVDSANGICTSVNHALHELGFRPITVDACKNMIGNGARTLCSRALPDTSPRLLDSMFLKYCTHYQAHCLEDIRIYDDMLPLLQLLRKKGGKLAILSNKPDEQTQWMTGHLFEEGLFDCVLGMSPRFERKPDPSALLHMMQAFDLRAEDAVIIGDSPEDIQTGKNAAIATIGVSWGFRPRSSLACAGADRIADSVDQLRNILLVE